MNAAQQRLKLAVVGAGWAGLAAAVRATQHGHQVTVFEASHHVGGRARCVAAQLPDASEVRLDNGQHILIGAYQESLELMRTVGVDPEALLLRLPLRLQFADGTGLALPDASAPWDVLAGVLGARGWSWRDKLSLLRAALRWQLAGFSCAPELSVTQLCHSLTRQVMQGLIEPLCVSALNTPADRASATVFLRVLRDSLFATPGGSNLLLPRVDLSTLFPDAALRWLEQHGGAVQLGQRIDVLSQQNGQWLLGGETFDRVVLALTSHDAVRLIEHSLPQALPEHVASLVAWQGLAQGLQHEAITTVYAYAPQARLTQPMLALRSDVHNPAQFAFDRGQLGGPRGLIALVVSASLDERGNLEHQVLQQVQSQLGLTLQPLKTITEKRATFACTPSLQRPPMIIAPGLRACGDYVDGPYPATLEGAVRSGRDAVT